MPVRYDDFDALAYAQEYFAIHDGRLTWEVISTLNYMRRLTSAHPLDGARVLSVGTGPTLLEAICFAERAERIDATDVSPAVLAALEGWVQGEAYTAEFAPQIAHWLAECDTPSESPLDPTAWSRIDPARVRRCADALRRRTRVSRWDVFADPAPPQGVAPYDAVVALFCLEAASASVDEWRRGLAAIVAQVAPGGLFVLATLLDAEVYRMGDEIHSVLRLDRAVVDAEFARHGLELVEPGVFEFVEDNPKRTYDAVAYFTARRLFDDAVGL